MTTPIAITMIARRSCGACQPSMRWYRVRAGSVVTSRVWQAAGPRRRNPAAGAGHRGSG